MDITQPQGSKSPKQRKNQQGKTSQSSNPTGIAAVKQPRTSAAKPEEQTDCIPDTPQSQPSECAKEDVKSKGKSNDVKETTPPGEPSTNKADSMAPSTGSRKPSTETEDLKDFGKSILEALNLLGEKDAEQANEEYQKLIQQQKRIFAEISREAINHWEKNNDSKTKECPDAYLQEDSNPLAKSLKEVYKKDKNKALQAMAEHRRIKSLLETFGVRRKHVTQVDVSKQQTNPTEQKDTNQLKGHNGDGNGKESATTDDKSSTNESDKTSNDGQRGDKPHSGIITPDGYTLISCKELETMRYELQNQRESIEELTSRLSAIASNRLKEGNPNIADLSDKNRPTKLGECFASLYDDEWSEALEEIGEKDTDDDDEEDLKSIQKLLDVVKLAYKFCGDEATAQLHKIANGMKDAVSLAPSVNNNTTQDKKSNPPTGNKTEIKTAKTEPKTGAGSPSPNRTAGSPNNSTNLQATGKAVKPLNKAVDGKPGQQGKPSDVQKTKVSGAAPESTRSPTPTGTKDAGVKDEKAKEEANQIESETWSFALRSAQSFRKETALNVVPQIKQLFKDFYIKEMKLESASSLSAAMDKYIDRCVELIWLMSVQDPPMEIKWVENGARSDTNYFKFYQSKGKMVKQCVWPAVFLSAQGGIVSKGAIIGMAPPKDT
ncbi:myb-like protein X isoform X2 [Argopecten irradians]|uniref:myb-like protein X isoform X2 n=1 Tax=Argopecten irradians TaxID=31199 RepID=UPI003718FED7